MGLDVPEAAAGELGGRLWHLLAPQQVPAGGQRGTENAMQNVMKTW